MGGQGTAGEFILGLSGKRFTESAEATGRSERGILGSSLWGVPGKRPDYRDLFSPRCHFLMTNETGCFLVVSRSRQQLV